MTTNGAWSSRSRVENVLLWLLIAAIACPVRIELRVGPFTTISALDVAVVLATAYVSMRFACLQPLRLGPPLLAVSVLAPTLIAILSLGWAADPNLSAASVIKYIYCAVAYFVALQFGTMMSQSRLARALALILVAWLAGSAAMYIGVPGFSYFLPDAADISPAELADTLASIYTRLGHPYVGQSNDYGPVLALVAFALLGHARATKSKVFLTLSAAAFLSCVLTFSRGLGVGLALATAVYCIVERPKVLPLILLIVVVGIAATVTLAALEETVIEVQGRDVAMADIIESRLSEINVQSRVISYNEAIEQISARPLLGYGAGYYPKEDLFALTKGSTHNSLLDQWRYFGTILGTITFLCYITIVVGLWQLRRKQRIRNFATALACGSLCLLFASLGETFFEATAPRQIIYLLLGLCVGTWVSSAMSRSPIQTSRPA